MGERYKVVVWKGTDDSSVVAAGSFEAMEAVANLFEDLDMLCYVEVVKETRRAA